MADGGIGEAKVVVGNLKHPRGTLDKVVRADNLQEAFLAAAGVLINLRPAYDGELLASA